jgi:transcriptional regulator with XRE-family HTH domain
MVATRILSENIGSLLRARGQSQKDLAFWCRHTETWISSALRGDRSIRMKDFDRIADFFGIAVYQLFQPGISPLTERRKKERRSGHDRRVSNAHRVMREARKRIEPLDPESRRRES